MSKNKSEGGTALATKAGAGSLAPKYDYGQMAGRGFENQTNADISIPFLGVLQPMSPEVEKGNAAKIEGAEAGMMFNTVTGEIFDGDKGLFFQPVDTEHCFVEWRPRNAGGGFVAKHAIDSEVVKKAKDAAKDFGRYTHAGNDLIETFYILGFFLRDGADQTAMGEPTMIAFTSTKIKVYKHAMTRIRTFAGRPPLFAHRLRLTTVSEKNAKGSFFNFKIEPAVENDIGLSLIPPTLGENPHPLLLAGEELLKASRSGMTKVNYESQAGKSGEAPAGGGGAEGEEPPF